MKLILTVISALFLYSANAQLNIGNSLIRGHKPLFGSGIKLIDLDKDGDPDLISATINDSINVYWIDDDDDMSYQDSEGDLDNDCLIIDRNNDGIFAGPGDLSLDWVDGNSDGIADMQVVVENSRPEVTNYWEWGSNYMWIIDEEQDEQFHYINWKKLELQAWEHSGSTNFYEDYHGQTLFQKVHIPSYRFSDLRYSWENPFLFYDIDNDGLTEVAIRLEDSCEFNKKKSVDYRNVDTRPTAMIDHAYLSFDLDNDNNAGNEFDFDMSIFFSGEGFSYANQVHQFDNMQGLPEADSLFFDSRWRNMKELIYTDHDSAWNMVFKKGEWEQCWFVFDEDDDCERWERVEFYQPKNPFKIGMNKGGIDNNPQADASGDRGEWDLDNSGEGKLYIGFDNRIHLFGAETGYWRIDQDASSYQGWGGLYAGQYARDQKIPEKFATVAYEDTDNDGYLDFVKYDLDGDTIFEISFNLMEIGIETSFDIYNPIERKPEDLNLLFEKAADQMWTQAEQAIDAATKCGVNYKWYSQLLHPKSLNEKYRSGYWLQFYLFIEIYNIAEKTENSELKRNLLNAYFGQNWSILCK